MTDFLEGVSLIVGLGAGAILMGFLTTLVVFVKDNFGMLKGAFWELVYAFKNLKAPQWPLVARLRARRARPTREDLEAEISRLRAQEAALRNLISKDKLRIAELEFEKARLVAPYVDENHKGGSWEDVWFAQLVKIQKLEAQLAQHEAGWAAASPTNDGHLPKKENES